MAVSIPSAMQFCGAVKITGNSIFTCQGLGNCYCSHLIIVFSNIPLKDFQMSFFCMKPKTQKIEMISAKPLDLILVKWLHVAPQPWAC